MAYTGSDPIAPLQDLLNGLEDAANAQFAVRQIKTYRWANTAARTATTGMSNGDEGFQSDTGAPYIRIGGAWVIATDFAETPVYPALLNGWVAAGGAPVVLRKVGRFVTIEGQVGGGTAQNIFQLPAGMRPFSTKRLMVRAGTSETEMAPVSVFSDGYVQSGGTYLTTNFSGVPAFQVQ